MSGTRNWRGWTPKLGASEGAGVIVVTFLRILGLIYCIAFVSFGVQASGLIGSHGILPFGVYLMAARKGLGRAAYWNLPTLLWLYPHDLALTAVWMAGAVCSLAAVWGRGQGMALALCLVLWLSLCSVGQDFLSFQWDILLSEAGFLALFADATRVPVWLFRWLMFRLMFFSGAVKWLSHDPTWRNFTALTYHYETQPLPTPLAWYMQQLPSWFQKASVGVVFFVEVAVPFLFFAPRRLRHIGAWITIGFQVLILLTGNYTFFNILTIALAMWLFVDVRPHKLKLVPTLAGAVIVVIGGLLFLQLFSIPLPPGGSQVLRAVDPLRLVNSYGLFAVMTTTRPEIIVEGSSDGVNWQAYEFPYKPGDVNRRPPIVAPHQPRLDWQMWFAALGSYQENRWFVNLMLRLLQGEPRVLRLFSYNPFPKQPPKYVRARVYQYHFTHWGDKAWWRCEEQGLYFPAVSLK